MGYLKKLLGQTVVYGLSSIVGRFLNYLFVPFYTRIFLPQEYGIVTELYAYAVLLQILLTYGMETGYFRLINKEENKSGIFSTIFSSLTFTSAVFLVLVYTFLPSLGVLLDYVGKEVYIMWLCLIVATDALTAIPYAKLRNENKALKFAALKLSSIGLNIVFNVIFLILFPYLHSLGWKTFDYFIVDDMVRYVFISNLLSNIIILAVMIPDILKERFIINKAILKVALSYSLPLLVAGLAGTVNEVSDRFFIKYLVSIPQTVSDSNQYVMAQLGIYGANIKLAVIITLCIQSFRYAFEPFLFSYSKNEDNKKAYSQIMTYFVYFCLIICLLVLLNINIFKYFIGEKYWDGLHTVPYILYANVFLGILFNLSLWYKLTDKTKYGLYITIIGSIVTIVLNITFIPIYSYKAAAVTHLIANVVMVIVSYLIGQKFYKVDYEVKKIIYFILFSLTLYLLSMYIQTKINILNFIINNTLILLFLLAVLVTEKNSIKKIIYANKNSK
ncbi:MAG: oligosaccharide flippase family protein [Bacteroidales bacterium]